jgi:CubicO group peptidase (beta-lactamase class C family)
LVNKLALISIVTLLLLSLASCSADQGKRGESGTTWPTDGWTSAAPEDLGLDDELIGDMLEEIQSKNLTVHSLLVVYRGVIIAEEYSPPYQQASKHAIYSVTKSIVSGLVGIAIDKGYLEGVDQPVLPFFPEYHLGIEKTRKQDLTIEHLLTMSSGLADASEGLDAQQDWIKYILDLPLISEPGSEFSYNSGNTHLLSAILQKSSSLSTRDFADVFLMKPIGIQDYTWERDPQGINLGGWGIRMTSRDMARIGYLYLNQGVWDGTQVIPSEWVDASTQAYFTVPNPLEPWGLSMGYSWWIHDDGPFAAHGSGGQFIYVIPDADLVVVITADVPDEQFAQLQILIREHLIASVPTD